jgi:hypothetical protein
MLRAVEQGTPMIIAPTTLERGSLDTITGGGVLSCTGVVARNTAIATGVAAAPGIAVGVYNGGGGVRGFFNGARYGVMYEGLAHRGAAIAIPTVTAGATVMFSDKCLGLAR